MKRILLLACLTLGYTSAAKADGLLRCHGKLITVGVAAAYVLETCGPPQSQLTQEVPARSRTLIGSRFSGIAVSDQWIYDRGWGRFPAVLVFVDGTLRRIDLAPHRS